MTRRKRGWIVDLLTDYLIPPKCAGCGELIPADSDTKPFCDACKESWNNEALEPCSSCGLSMRDCVCLPTLLTENGIRDGLFLTAYRTGGLTVPDRLILSIKSEKDRHAFSFLARELSYLVKRYVRDEELPSDRIVIAALPRRRRSVREKGFDHAVVLARALSAETGYPYLNCLARRHGGREQKHLGREERIQNLRNAFRYCGTDSVSGKFVFLVDDVMTTGSGLLACAEILLSAGAERVIPTVIARTAEEQ